MRPFAHLSILGCLLFTPPVFAQELTIPDVTYPALAKSAAAAEGFVPEGWKIELRSSGDLNGDGIDDLLLVLRDRDPKNIVAFDGLGESPLDTNPRILAAALGGEGYRLVLENHTLIARRTDPVLDDVLAETGGVTIDRGSIKVDLHFFSSAGSWTMENRSLRFRYRNENFELIGFDRTSVNRSDGGIEELSINYLTRKVEVGTGTIENDETKVTHKKLKSRRLLGIDEVGDGMEFEPKI